MIKINNLKEFNLEGAIRGMRQPYKNTERSDSTVSLSQFALGEKDLQLAQRLVKAGSPHDKFLRQIFVSMDITAPRYWWSEFDTYKVGTTVNSESTMHTITNKKFSKNDFSYDGSFYDNPELVGELGLTLLVQDIFLLNRLIDFYKEETESTRKKEIWKTIIHKLPSSYMQTRTWTGDYAIVRSIIKQREGHKLIEWAEFIEKMKELPYSAELLFLKENKNVNRRNSKNSSRN